MAKPFEQLRAQMSPAAQAQADRQAQAALRPMPDPTPGQGAYEKRSTEMFVPSTLLPPIVHPLPYAVFLFDADGTLRETVVDGRRQARPPNAPGEWQLLPKVQETLAQYDWTQRGCAIVSNQGGVGLSYMTEHTARFLLQETLSEATGSVVGPQQVWMCPHKPDAGCPCRKPKALLLEQAQMPWHRHAILHGPDGVLYVGDQDSDWQAATTAGIDFCWATDFFGWEAPSHA